MVPELDGLLKKNKKSASSIPSSTFHQTQSTLHQTQSTHTRFQLYAKTMLSPPSITTVMAMLDAQDEKTFNDNLSAGFGDGNTSTERVTLIGIGIILGMVVSLVFVAFVILWCSCSTKSRLRKREGSFVEL